MRGQCRPKPAGETSISASWSGVGSHRPCASAGGKAAAGPVVVNSLRSYVTMRAGGYFFLPSRSALEYLVGLR